MDKLTLIYENGRMTLNVPVFFPCSLNIARKIFPFIGRWASEKDYDSLMDYLMEEYGKKRILLAEYKAGAEEADDYYTEKKYRALYNKTAVLENRLKRNIEYLIGGRSI